MILVVSIPTEVAAVLVGVAIAATLGWAIVRRSPVSIVAAALVAAFATLSPSFVVFGMIVAIPVGLVHVLASLWSPRRGVRT